MEKIRIVVLGVYICFAVIFLNFGINVLPNYQLTIAFFYPIFFLLLGRFSINIYKVMLYLFVILLPIFIAIVGFISYLEFDLSHFLRSYSLYFHFCTGLFVVNSINFECKNLRGLDRAIFIALVIVVVFTLLQVVVSLYLGYPFLFNPFGKYLIGGESDTARFVLDGRVRPTGFYWEPSTDAVVIFILMNYMVIRNIDKFKKIYLYQFVIQFIVNSTTGLISTFITFFLWFNSVTRKYVLLKLLFVFFILICFVYFYFERLSEVTVTGGSGFFRWAIPFNSFIDYVQKYPLGLPLGQLAVQLDNGLFVALIYTGIIGLIIFLLLVFMFVRRMFNNSLNVQTQIFIISIVLIMIFNGAFLTPEMSFLTCLITVAWKSQKTIN
jgi:hypothetical protein